MGVRAVDYVVDRTLSARRSVHVLCTRLIVGVWKLGVTSLRKLGDPEMRVRRGYIFVLVWTVHIFSSRKVLYRAVT